MGAGGDEIGIGGSHTRFVDHTVAYSNRAEPVGPTGVNIEVGVSDHNSALATQAAEMVGQSLLFLGAPVVAAGDALEKVVQPRMPEAIHDRQGRGRGNDHQSMFCRQSLNQLFHTLKKRRFSVVESVRILVADTQVFGMSETDLIEVLLPVGAIPGPKAFGVFHRQLFVMLETDSLQQIEVQLGGVDHHTVPIQKDRYHNEEVLTLQVASPR